MVTAQPLHRPSATAGSAQRPNVSLCKGDFEGARPARRDSGSQRGEARARKTSAPTLTPLGVFTGCFSPQPVPHFHFPACCQLLNSPELIASPFLTASRTCGAGLGRFCILARGRIPVRWKMKGKDRPRGAVFYIHKGSTALPRPSQLFVLYHRLFQHRFFSFLLRTHPGGSNPSSGYPTLRRSLLRGSNHPGQEPAPL